MKRRKRPLFLMVAVCLALVVAWLSRAGFIHLTRTETKAGPQTETARYTVENRIRIETSDLVINDRSVQFTFSGNTTISPGSLRKMTIKMHRDEVEIATRLARDIKFPTPP